MLFIHIIFGLLVTIALLSLRNNFGDTRLFITFTLIGFATSWWQEKKAQSIPYLKIILNVLLVALTIKALLPFLINKPTDILSGLIKTWIYFLILCTFAIHSKRDYHLIQVLSLGLVVFSCFSQTTPGTIRLSYILAFFIIWVIALRCISLLKDINEIKQSAHYKKWIYQEFKIGIIFIITMFILTVPLYVIMPRVNIPFSPLYRFVEQKNILTYTDFIGKGLYSFFGRSGKKLSLSETKSKKAKVDGINKELRTGMGFMD